MLSPLLSQVIPTEWALQQAIAGGLARVMLFLSAPAPQSCRASRPALRGPAWLRCHRSGPGRRPGRLHVKVVVRALDRFFAHLAALPRCCPLALPHRSTGVGAARGTPACWAEPADLRRRRTTDRLLALPGAHARGHLPGRAGPARSGHCLPGRGRATPCRRGWTRRRFEPAAFPAKGGRARRSLDRCSCSGCSSWVRSLSTRRCAAESLAALIAASLSALLAIVEAAGLDAPAILAGRPVDMGRALFPAARRCRSRLPLRPCWCSSPWPQRPSSLPGKTSRAAPSIPLGCSCLHSGASWSCYSP